MTHPKLEKTTCILVHCSGGKKDHPLIVNVLIQDGFHISEIKAGSPAPNNKDIYVVINKIGSDKNGNRPVGEGYPGYKLYMESLDIPYDKANVSLEIFHDYKHHIINEHGSEGQPITHRSGGVIIDPRK